MKELNKSETVTAKVKLVTLNKILRIAKKRKRPVSYIVNEILEKTLKTA